MRIEAYFRQFQKSLNSCPVLSLSQVSFDKRSTHTGYIKAEISFIDGSVLHVREFVDVETREDRLMYVYQYVSASDGLIFRYDNTGHHKKLKLPTYPHHKHDRTEENVIAVQPSSLAQILEEIEQLVLQSKTDPQITQIDAD